jgi:hypothetical protein
MLMAAAGGSLNGVFNTWSGSFAQVLDPLPSCASSYYSLNTPFCAGY